MFLSLIHRLFILYHEIYYINTTTAFYYFRQTVAIDRLEMNKSFLYQFYFYRCHSFYQAFEVWRHQFKRRYPQVNEKGITTFCKSCSERQQQKHKNLDTDVLLLSLLVTYKMFDLTTKILKKFYYKSFTTC